MLDRFREHLANTNLIPNGTRVLVGYSGGPDSTCLVHLLHKCGIDVVAAHLNHGQRVEGDEEERKCGELCATLDIPFVSGKADVPGMARDLRVGPEEAGRIARYEFFRQASFRLGCGLVATAHTRDDHAETILLNLARGTGLDGLGGIRAQRDNIVRPLLPFSRQETLSYCREHSLWTHDDPANTDVTFSRARVRHRVLPELLLVNSAADANIARLGHIAAEEDEFLNSAAAAALERAEVPLNGDLAFMTSDVELALDGALLLHIPPVLLRRMLRLAVEALGAEMDFAQTQHALQGVTGGSSGSVTTEGGQVVIEWTETRVTVRNLAEEAPFRHPLTIPGETTSEEYGWSLIAEPVATSQVLQRASLQASVDMDRAAGNLYFKSFAEGDRMQPLGFEGSRKLSDLLGEARLTSAARKRLPIVCDMVGPIWAPGICLSERVRPTENSTRVLSLRLVQTASPNETQGWSKAYANRESNPLETS